MKRRVTCTFGRIGAALGVSTLLCGCGEAPAGGDNTGQAQTEVDGAMWTTTTERGRYVVSFGPRDGVAPIGQFHEWVIEVSDANGAAQTAVRLGVDGSMPAHGHGLPTRPQVTEHLGEGRYLVEGVRFNMAGRWQLVVGVDGAAARDRAVFDIDLDF